TAAGLGPLDSASAVAHDPTRPSSTAVLAIFQCDRASGITANAALPFCRSTVPSQSALTQSALTLAALTLAALILAARARTAPWQAVLAPTERPASSRSPFRAAGNTSPLPE